MTAFPAPLVKLALEYYFPLDVYQDPDSEDNSHFRQLCNFTACLHCECVGYEKFTCNKAMPEDKKLYIVTLPKAQPTTKRRSPVSRAWSRKDVCTAQDLFGYGLWPPDQAVDPAVAKQYSLACVTDPKVTSTGVTVEPLDQKKRSHMAQDFDICPFLWQTDETSLTLFCDRKVLNMDRTMFQLAVKHKQQKCNTCHKPYMRCCICNQVQKEMYCVWESWMGIDVLFCTEKQGVCWHWFATETLHLFSNRCNVKYMFEIQQYVCDCT